MLQLGVCATVLAHGLCASATCRLSWIGWHVQRACGHRTAGWQPASARVRCPAWQFASSPELSTHLALQPGTSRFIPRDQPSSRCRGGHATTNPEFCQADRHERAGQYHNPSRVCQQNPEVCIGGSSPDHVNTPRTGCTVHGDRSCTRCGTAYGKSSSPRFYPWAPAEPGPNVCQS